MRASLIIFGMIFLAIGIVLYFVPIQEIKADTTTSGNGEVDTQTSSASVTVPLEWAYASAIIGFILLMLGLIGAGPAKAVQGIRGPRGRRGPVQHRNAKRKSRRRVALPRGTSVTTTTRIKR